MIDMLERDPGMTMPKYSTARSVVEELLAAARALEAGDYFAAVMHTAACSAYFDALVMLYVGTAIEHFFRMATGAPEPPKMWAAEEAAAKAYASRATGDA